MTRKQFSIWIFPITLSILIISTLFTIIFERPVLGALTGAIFGSIVGLLTKLISDDFPILFNEVYEKKVTIDHLLLVPRIFFEIWFIPIKRLTKFLIKYTIISAGVILIVTLIIIALIKGL